MFVVIAVIVSAALVGVDQFTKYLAFEYLPEEGDYVTVIDGVLRFTHVENTGAVFGSFANHTAILTVFSLVLLAGAIFLLATNKSRSKLINICLLLMISGGIGNIIDRIRLGFVVDFIEPTFINFAVFNFADCLITVSAALLIGYLIYDFVKDAKKNKSAANVIEKDLNTTENDNGAE